MRNVKKNLINIFNLVNSDKYVWIRFKVNVLFIHFDLLKYNLRHHTYNISPHFYYNSTQCSLYIKGHIRYNILSI